MARIFTCGFECPGNIPLATSYTGTFSDHRRSGSYSFYSGVGTSGYNGFNVIFPSATRTEIYFRFAYKAQTFGNAGDRVFLYIDGDAGNIAYLCGNHSGGDKILAYVNGVSIGSFSVTYGVWYLLEGYLKVDDSAGVFQIKADGVDKLLYTGDTKPTTTSNITNFHFFNGGGGYNSQWFYDDIAINDTTGLTHNSWPGDGYIVPLRPSGAGSTTEWTPNAGANYAAVDEASYDSGTTYIYTATDDQSDLYAAGDITVPLGYHITGVQIYGMGRKMASGDEDILLLLKSGSTTEEYENQKTISLSWGPLLSEFIETDPDTTLAWTNEGVNAIEIGVKSVIN